jgi:hypothetical protein
MNKAQRNNNPLCFNMVTTICVLSYPYTKHFSLFHFHTKQQGSRRLGSPAH